MNRVLISSIKIGLGASVIMVMRELKRALENESIVKYMDRGVVNYIAAVGALAFTGRDIYTDGIVSLLEAIDIVPDTDILNTLRVLHLKNHLVYINAFFFLTFIGKEPTIDGIIDVVKAMDIAPDAVTAGYVIEYIKEYLTLRYNSIDVGPNLQGKELEAFKKLSSGAIEMVDTVGELVIKEISVSLQNKAIMEHMSPKMVPYIGAMISLAFSGKDIDPEDVSKLLMSSGISPSREALGLISAMRFKNYIFYIIALYFLLSAGVEPTSDYIISVVKALGTYPDAPTAEYIMSYYKAKKQAGGFKWLKI